MNGIFKIFCHRSLLSFVTVHSYVNFDILDFSMCEVFQLLLAAHCTLKTFCSDLLTIGVEGEENYHVLLS